MYVCICNTFNEKTLCQAYETAPLKTPGAVYREASGNRPAQCCKCIPMVRAYVEDRNAAAAVESPSPA